MTTTAINHEEYRQQIARVGVNPFLRQVVQTPWSAVTDVATLHSDIRNHMLSVVLGSAAPDAVRSYAIQSLPGYGKTHILAWLRQELEQNHRVYFTYVPPFNPNEDNARTPMQHIVHSVYDAVWNRSQKQRHSFEQSIRSFLVSCYDGLIKDKNHGQVKKVLGVGTIWEWLFSWSGLTIGGKEEKAKLAALRSAIRRREFLNYAYEMLRQKGQTAPTGVETDWDTFVACCLLACGNTMQQWNGSEWFTQTTMTSMAELAKAHLNSPCTGHDKMINALYTIQQLSDSSFAIVFDQYEDTLNAIFSSTSNNSNNQDAGKAYVLFTSIMLTIPRIAHIFSFPSSGNQELLRCVPSMLLQRIGGSHGMQKLKTITLDQAKDLVRVYMRSGVWDKLKSDPPDDEKLYPFTPAEIAENRIAKNQELRPFLQWCCQRFEEWLSRPIAAQKMTISSIQPTNIISETPQPLILKGTHLPANIRVTFNGIVSALTPIARPADGEIDVTPPPNLPTGPVTVCIEETKNPENQATITLDVTSITDVPRPYSYWIDGKKLKSQREHLKQLHSPQYTQDWVSEEINRSLPHLRLNKNRISQLENGKWTDAPDEVYDSLAALYGVPLHQLQREASSP